MAKMADMHIYGGNLLFQNSVAGFLETWYIASWNLRLQIYIKG